MKKALNRKSIWDSYASMDNTHFEAHSTAINLATSNAVGGRPPGTKLRTRAQSQ